MRAEKKTPAARGSGRIEKQTPTYCTSSQVATQDHREWVRAYTREELGVAQTFIADTLIRDPVTGGPVPLWQFSDNQIFGLVLAQVTVRRLTNGWRLAAASSA